MQLEPKGRRILIRPTKIEKKSEGGIILPEDTVDKEQRAATTGVVVAIGDLAWEDFPEGKHWAEVGDTIVFKAHQGMRIKSEETGEYDLLLLNDLDVAATVKENP